MYGFEILLLILVSVSAAWQALLFVTTALLTLSDFVTGISKKFWKDFRTVHEENKISTAITATAKIPVMLADGLVILVFIIILYSVCFF